MHVSRVRGDWTYKGAHDVRLQDAHRRAAADRRAMGEIFGVTQRRNVK